MSEEDQFENLKLIGRFTDFESPNISETMGDLSIEDADPIINEPEHKVTIQLPKKEISKKIPQKKPIVHYNDDDYEDYEDDYFSETSSQISYAESYHSIGNG